MPTKLPSRADHVGSFLRPRSVIEAREHRAAGNIDYSELRAIEDAAIAELVGGALGDAAPAEPGRRSGPACVVGGVGLGAVGALEQGLDGCAGQFVLQRSVSLKYSQLRRPRKIASIRLSAVASP